MTINPTAGAFLPYLLDPPVRATVGLDPEDGILGSLPIPRDAKERLTLWKKRLKFAAGLETSPLKYFSQNSTMFVRVPKNASTALMAYLYGGNFLLPHFGAEFYRRIFPIEFARFLVFSTVRHPMKRFASAFHYLKEVSGKPENRKLMDERYGFISSLADFVSYINEQPDIGAVPIMRWHHFRPQKEYLCDADGRVIVDLLFSLENIDSGMAVLRRFTGQPGELPLANPSRRQYSTAGLDLSRIEAYYGDDYRLWQDVNAQRIACFSPLGQDAAALRATAAEA